MPKLSVIVPVRNGEAHLGECLHSISQQILDDIEIILVVGPSSDRSLEICQQFQKDDSRVKLLITSSADSGIAKNIGIENATGKNLTFIRQEDSVIPEFSTLLTTIVEGNNCDITSCSYLENEARTPLEANNNVFNGVYTPMQWLENSLGSLEKVAYSSWGKVYRQKIFQSLRFATNVEGQEDQFTIWKACLIAKRISFTNFWGYKLQTENHFTPVLQLRALEEQISTLDLLGQSTKYLQDYQLTLLQTIAPYVGDARLKLKLIREKKYGE